MQPEAKLALFHLMDATGNLSRPEDYQEFAKLAIVNNQPGVAQTVLTKAGGSIGADPMTAKLAQAAAQRAQQRAPSRQAGRQPGDAAQAGGAYLGLGQYPAAAAAYAKAARPAAAMPTARSSRVSRRSRAARRALPRRLLPASAKRRHEGHRPAVAAVR